MDAKNVIPVRAQAESEVFKMVSSGKRKKKAWKRMVSIKRMAGIICRIL